MAYRYEPKTEDIGKLAELLGSNMPFINFRFRLDRQTGMLRICGSTGSGSKSYRYYEQLLRNNHSPESVVETFRDKLECPTLTR